MATLAFLQIDALVPLPGASDVKEGFTRVPLMLCPAFSAQVTEYHAAAPSNAAALSACASSFAAVDVRINSQPGSLLQLPLPAGSTADFPVAATLHARPDGATAATYTVHVGRNAPAVTGGDTVKIDTSAPVPAAAPAHAHSHGGVPCTHDHGHGTAAPAKKEEQSHGHGHGDHGHSHAAAAPKAAEAHGHSHAAPKAEAHGHAHDSATCTDASHDHGHGHGGHGHAHGGETKADAVPKAAAHGHSHDGKACNDASHGHAHAHGHGHGAEMDEGSDDDDSSLHAALHGQGGATGLLAPVPGVAGARWAQDADSVTVELMVPPGTRAADVAVVIGTARLDAGLKGVAGALAGVLGGRVSRDESSWSLCDDAGTRMLVISLAKDGSDAKKWSKLLA